MDSSWNSPGQNTGVGSLSLLQGIFPTQGSNQGLPHCRQTLYHLSHQGNLAEGLLANLCNILPRLVIAFLARSKCLLISWLQSPSAVVLKPKKIKFVTVFIFSTFIYHEVMELDAMIFAF